MKKDFKKIAAQRKAAAERSAVIHARIEKLDAEMRACEPGSPEEDALAKKLTRLIFMGTEE
jgi:hypothetical protein